MNTFRASIRFCLGVRLSIISSQLSLFKPSKSYILVALTYSDIEVFIPTITSRMTLTLKRLLFVLEPY